MSKVFFQVHFFLASIFIILLLRSGQELSRLSGKRMSSCKISQIVCVGARECSCVYNKWKKINTCKSPTHNTDIRILYQIREKYKRGSNTERSQRRIANLFSVHYHQTWATCAKVLPATNKYKYNRIVTAFPSESSLFLGDALKGTDL